jgi:hypothetical protein
MKIFVFLLVIRNIKKTLFDFLIKIYPKWQLLKIQPYQYGQMDLDEQVWLGCFF